MIDPAPDHLARYHRQMLLPGFGREGQERLRAARVLIVGCGALGTVLADTLARAGVGFLRLVDRDVVELTNLQRQILFTEADVEQGLPKAEAARRALGRINRDVQVEAVVADFHHANAPALATGIDLILDGLDNFQTRYLLNDLAVRQGLPYLYGGAVGTTGMAMVFLPHAPPGPPGPARGRIDWPESLTTPCLRCVFPEAPPPGSTPTCDTAGVLASVVAFVAHHQATQALKLLIGAFEALDRSLVSIDLWRNEFRRLDLSGARREECPCCGQRVFSALDGHGESGLTTLCGRGAVQVRPDPDRARARLDLDVLAARLAPHGSFQATPFLLRGTLDRERGEHERPVELTLFPDGRALFTHVTRPEHARTLYDRYIGG